MRTLISIMLAILLSACGQQQVITEPVIRPIAWTTVSISDHKQVRTLSGIIAPVEAATLSFEVSGKAQTVSANLGDMVKKGQQLAQLNQRTFSLSVQSAQATLNQAQATFADASNEYKRYQTLIEQGLVSQSGFDSAKAKFQSSQSAVAVAQAQLDIAKKNLQDSTLIAPYNGIITKRLVEPPQQVVSGQAVFEIEGDHGLEVQVMVPETLIRELEKHSKLNITFPVLPQVMVTGHISEIGTRAESANAFPVTVILDDDHEALRAGMTAEVKFIFDGVGRTGYTGPSIKVPLSALAAGLEQQSYVFVFDQQTQTLTKRQVQTENVVDNQVLISQGLTDGEIIATAGVAFLRDGQKVSLLDPRVQRFN